jgi:transketolase
MIYNAGLGHAGGDLSSMDILTTLYGDVLRVDPSYPNDPNRDRFFMSKGHCTGALYATLAEVGFFPQDELASYMRPLSRLNGHPDCKTTPGVETNTGPLGHGLPVAVGTALAAKLQGATWRTFVLTGDGELQEGSNWEAAMAAAHYELDNLTLVIDRNCLQQGDRTETTNRLEPLADKWRAFGWSVQEVDGHDYDGLLKRFFAVPFESGKPSCIIAHTHKGEGVSFMRGQVGWHHRVPTEAELSVALEELKQSSS